MNKNALAHVLKLLLTQVKHDISFEASIEAFIDLLEHAILGVPEVKFRVEHPEGKPPFYATTGAAGADISSTEKFKLQPGAQHIFSTGIFLEVPMGYECQIRPRSGLAASAMVSVTNAPGTLDSDYRGELKVMLINHGASQVVINRGDRIAQIVIARVAQAKFTEVTQLSQTSRGQNGFGSTGR